jgi:hypothetical protein
MPPGTKAGGGTWKRVFAGVGHTIIAIGKRTESGTFASMGSGSGQERQDKGRSQNAQDGLEGFLRAATW